MEVVGITVVGVVIIKMPPKKKRGRQARKKPWGACVKSEDGKFYCNGAVTARPACKKQGCGNCARHCNCKPHAKEGASGTRKPLKNISNLQQGTLSGDVSQLSFEELEQKSNADFDRLEQEGKVCFECKSY
jgi:hypothetical protein